VLPVVLAALVATQRCGKHISAAVNQHATIEEAVFSVRQLRDRTEGVSGDGSWQMMESSFGVPSEQLVESWALQGRLRRWRFEFRSGALTCGQRRDHGS
jgi:hypothetical protein